MGLASIGLILLMGVFIVDYVKNIYLRQTYESYAQKAVQTAIKEQDGIGGLKWQSAEILVKEYLIQRNGRVNTTERVYSNCGDDYPKFRITYDNKRRQNSTSQEVNYNFSSGTDVSIIPSNHSKFHLNQYNVVQVEVTENVGNYFTSIFGIPCTKIVTKASGIAVSAFDDTEIDQRGTGGQTEDSNEETGR